jgi:hypothetical protein
MAFDSLRDPTFSGVKLHGALDFECRGIVSVPRDANKDEPFLIGCDSIIDDLGALKSSMAVKDLLWWRSLVINGPVINSGVCDETNSAVRDPFPEDNVLVVDV